MQAASARFLFYVHGDGCLNLCPHTCTAAALSSYFPSTNKLQQIDH